MSSSGRKRSAKEMVEGSTPSFPAPKVLNAEQRRGWQAVMQDEKSVFITGRAGCGKSFLVKRLIDALRKQLGHSKVFVTAATGIAACNVNGVTLHSFAGIGLGKDGVATLVKRIKRNVKVKQRWRQAKVLVIDEISMIDAGLLDKLDKIARAVRDCDEVWGGLRLIMVGDFFQLPPVSCDEDDPKFFAFDAGCWKEIIGRDNVIDLRTQMRQQEDTAFTTLLNNLRVGRVPDGAAALLESAGAGLAALEAKGIKPTKLFPHNATVDAVNRKKLAALPGDVTVFAAKDTGSKAGKAQLAKNCRIPTEISLKVGAQVMLLRNLAQSLGLVNGVQGVVEDFVWATEAKKEKLPKVRFFTQHFGEQSRVLGREKWEIKVGRTVIAKRLQVPLRLSYAITIHKSQGMTIDALEVDLEGVFAPGQAYVALSRAVSLDRVRVRNFDPSIIKFNEDVLRFYYCVAKWRKEAAIASEVAEREAKRPRHRTDSAVVVMS